MIAVAAAEQAVAGTVSPPDNTIASRPLLSGDPSIHGIVGKSGHSRSGKRRVLRRQFRKACQLRRPTAARVARSITRRCVLFLARSHRPLIIATASTVANQFLSPLVHKPRPQEYLMPDRQRQVCVEGALNAHLSQPGDSSRPETDWKIRPKRGNERFSDISPHLSGGQRQQSDTHDRLAGGWTPAADPLPAVRVRSPARPFPMPAERGFSRPPISAARRPRPNPNKSPSSPRVPLARWGRACAHWARAASTRRRNAAPRSSVGRDRWRKYRWAASRQD